MNVWMVCVAVGEAVRAWTVAHDARSLRAQNGHQSLPPLPTQVRSTNTTQTIAYHKQEAKNNLTNLLFPLFQAPWRSQRTSQLLKLLLQRARPLPPLSCDTIRLVVRNRL